MQPRPLRIMLDPGHGGRDPGAVRGHVHERDLNSALAGLLREELESMGEQVELARPLVQKPREYTPPWQRAKMANALMVDCYLSLHTNACLKTEPRGVRFYIYRSGEPLSSGRATEALAAALQTQAGLLLSPAMPVDAIRARPKLTVLRRTIMPAVLIETGFISNPEDRELLQDTAFLQRAAVAYATGLIAWGKRNLEARA